MVRARRGAASRVRRRHAAFTAIPRSRVTSSPSSRPARIVPGLPHISSHRSSRLVRSDQLGEPLQVACEGASRCSTSRIPISPIHRLRRPWVTRGRSVPSQRRIIGYSDPDKGGAQWDRSRSASRCSSISASGCSGSASSREGESLIVLSQGDERAEYVDAFLDRGPAARRDGDEPPAPVLLVGDAPARSASGRSARRRSRGNQPAVDILKSADMVVETLFLLFSDELTEIQQAGTRILTCIEPVDLLARMFPTQELKRPHRRRARAARRRAQTLRFTNRAGTDVTYRIGVPVEGRSTATSTSPGQWDHWPSGGMVLTCGEDDGIDGRVVVDRGDILLPFKQYVAEPIEFTIEAGRITDIARRRLPGRARARPTSPTSTTPTPTASRTSAGASTSARSGPALATDSRGHGHGAAARSTATCSSRPGPTTSSAARTTRSCHLDIPMRGCSLYLDDTPGDRRRRGRRSRRCGPSGRAASPA